MMPVPYLRTIKGSAYVGDTREARPGLWADDKPQVVETLAALAGTEHGRVACRRLGSLEREAREARFHRPVVS